LVLYNVRRANLGERKINWYFIIFRRLQNERRSVSSM
jgi:hypothetical protein